MSSDLDRLAAASLPLTGLRVLDLTRMLPGNMCTLALALLGAEVIKVEDTAAGDYMREFGLQIGGTGACHLSVNRGKLSVTLDLKLEDDRRKFVALVKTADVLVESFRPGVLDRLGYSVKRLHEIKPQLVVASLSGYGATGPLAQQAGHDLNYLAFAGMLERLQPESGKSVPPPLPLADLVGGGILPAMLIVAYLRRASASGIGAWIDASLAEGIALLPHVLINDLVAGKTFDSPQDSFLGGGLACYDTYRLTDGQVAVAALEARFWNIVCDIIGGLDEYRTDHLCAEDQAKIRVQLTMFFAERSRAEIRELFGDRDTCVTVVQSYEEMLVSPQAQVRGFVVCDPNQPAPVLAFPAMVDGARLPERGPAPTQGEHNETVFRELV
jgi:alpha-methylacyl-CoA racemase